MDTRADSELVALARAGDKQAFGQLVERYQSMAQRIAMSMVRDAETARDLVQEAILQAYLSLGHLRDDARFKSWLYGIVLNVCRSFIRDQHADANLFSLEAIMGGLAFDALPFSGTIPSPQEIIEERERRRIVLEAIDGLSPKDREATLLFYDDQLSLQEIAALLGISVVAVKGRLHKARKHLRERLSSLYAEIHPTLIERKREMIKVTIADVVKRERTGEQGPAITHYIVMLLDEAGQRVLPIWVGPWEGQAIAIGLREFSPVPRPMTFTFMANLLEAASVKVEEVRVQTLKDETFYAVVKLHSHGGAREADARPSDAIALALRTGSPIYVAEDVMENEGAVVPADRFKAPTRRGAEAIVTELQEGMRAARPSHPRSKAEMEQSRQELIDQVFGP